MSSPVEIGDLVNSITADVRSIISDEIALVKEELRPSIRRVGVGSGLIGAAAYFVISATIVLWFAVASGFAWLFAGTTKLSMFACIFLGTVCAIVLLLIIAGVFVLLGGKSFSKIKGPEKSPESVAMTVSAIAEGIQDGNHRVAAELKDADSVITMPAVPARAISEPGFTPRIPVGGSSTF
ncbi:MAG: phage holin family protein [Propionibacteriaceae bacterium]|nr:phage holin family protein [Propionibacteriaceae bacterium]